jgi:magnesium transporter
MSFVEQEGLHIRSVMERKMTWFYIEKPTSREVEFLAERFHFHPLDLDDVLSRIQRPKIDVYKDYLFIVLHFPIFDKENRIMRPSETDIFIGENYVVTVDCSGDLKPLARFFQEPQAVGQVLPGMRDRQEESRTLPGAKFRISALPHS